MAATFVAAGTGSTATTATPGQPAGKAAGDLLLCISGARAATETLNGDPTGYTKLLDSDPTTSNNCFGLWGRFATNDANDDISHDFWSGSSNTYARILAFRGVLWTDLASIVVASSIAGSSSNTANCPNAAGLTVPMNDCVVLGFGKKSKTSISDGATFTSPAALTNRVFHQWQNGTVVGMVADYEIQTTAANVGTEGWTQSIAESLPYASFLLALRTDAPPNPKARMTQILAEIVSSGNPKARLSRMSVEVVSDNVPDNTAGDHAIIGFLT